MSEVKKTTEVREADNQGLEAAFYIEQAGGIIRPAGTKYLGSVCMHMYGSELKINQKEFAFATQFVNSLPEGIMIEAAKELKEQMMRRYGHEIKKRK